MTTIEQIKIRNQRTFSECIDQQEVRLLQREMLHLTKKREERKLDDWEQKRLDDLQVELDKVLTDADQNRVSSGEFSIEPNKSLLKIVQGF